MADVKGDTGMNSQLAWIVIVVIVVVTVGKVIYLNARKNNPQNTNVGRCTALRHIQNTDNAVAGNTGTRPIQNIVNPAIGITETGPIIYYANDHHDCRDKEYQFNYKKVGDSWRAYILRMPSLCGRDGNGSVTHRLYDGNSPYVCWDSPVETLKDMQTISKVWADSIQEYIATGKRFG
jgi:hypothetical protein